MLQIRIALHGFDVVKCRPLILHIPVSENDCGILQNSKRGENSWSVQQPHNSIRKTKLIHTLCLPGSHNKYSFPCLRI
jgi:hypothetical protein